MVVDVRYPGVGWGRPASITLSEDEALALIKAINKGLDEAQFTDTGD